MISFVTCEGFHSLAPSASYTPTSRYTNLHFPLCLPFPFPILSKLKNVNSQLSFMSSAGQATTSSSTIQSIIDALAGYTKVTGIDLSKSPFAASIERSNSPEAILELFQEREKAFKEYRSGNRRLIGCLGPAVKAIQAFSGILGEAVSLVSQHVILSSFK